MGLLNRATRAAKNQRMKKEKKVIAGWKDEELERLAKEAFSRGRSRLARGEKLTKEQINAIIKFLKVAREKRNKGELSEHDRELLRRFVKNIKKLGLTGQ